MKCLPMLSQILTARVVKAKIWTTEDRTEESDQSDEQLTETDHEVNACGLGTTYGSGMNFSEPYLTMLTHQSCH